MILKRALTYGGICIYILGLIIPHHLVAVEGLLILALVQPILALFGGFLLDIVFIVPVGWAANIYMPHLLGATLVVLLVYFFGGYIRTEYRDVVR